MNCDATTKAEDWVDIEFRTGIKWVKNLKILKWAQESRVTETFCPRGNLIPLAFFGSDVQEV